MVPRTIKSDAESDESIDLNTALAKTVPNFLKLSPVSQVYPSERDKRFSSSMICVKLGHKLSLKLYIDILHIFHKPFPLALCLIG